MFKVKLNCFYRVKCRAVQVRNILTSVVLISLLYNVPAECQVRNISSLTEEQFCTGHFNIQIEPDRIDTLLNYFKFCFIVSERCSQREGRTRREILKKLLEAATPVLHGAYSRNQASIEQIIGFTKFKKSVNEYGNVSDDDSSGEEKNSAGSNESEESAVISAQKEGSGTDTIVDSKHVHPCSDVMVQASEGGPLLPVLDSSKFPVLRSNKSEIEFPIFDDLTLETQSSDVPYLIADLYTFVLYCMNSYSMKREATVIVSTQFINWLTKNVMPFLSSDQFEKTLIEIKEVISNSISSNALSNRKGKNNSTPPISTSENIISTAQNEVTIAPIFSSEAQSEEMWEPKIVSFLKNDHQKAEFSTEVDVYEDDDTYHSKDFDKDTVEKEDDESLSGLPRNVLVLLLITVWLCAAFVSGLYIFFFGCCCCRVNIDSESVACSADHLCDHDSEDYNRHCGLALHVPQAETIEALRDRCSILSKKINMVINELSGEVLCEASQIDTLRHFIHGVGKDIQDDANTLEQFMGGFEKRKKINKRN